jgi:hypothetical protein
MIPPPSGSFKKEQVLLILIKEQENITNGQAKQATEGTERPRYSTPRRCLGFVYPASVR